MDWLHWDSSAAPWAPWVGSSDLVPTVHGTGLRMYQGNEWVFPGRRWILGIFLATATSPCQQFEQDQRTVLASEWTALSILDF